MSPRASWLRLLDVLDAIHEIRTYTAGMDWSAFAKDGRTQRAVEMGLVIIGEAVGKMPEAWLAERPEVPWADIRGTRNIITHVYHGIDIGVIWSIVVQHLEPLEIAVRALAERHAPKDQST